MAFEFPPIPPAPVPEGLVPPEWLTDLAETYSEWQGREAADWATYNPFGDSPLGRIVFGLNPVSQFMDKFMPPIEPAQFPFGVGQTPEYRSAYEKLAAGRSDLTPEEEAAAAEGWSEYAMAGIEDLAALAMLITGYGDWEEAVGVMRQPGLINPHPYPTATTFPLNLDTQGSELIGKGNSLIYLTPEETYRRTPAYAGGPLERIAWQGMLSNEIRDVAQETGLTEEEVAAAIPLVVQQYLPGLAQHLNPIVGAGYDKYAGQFWHESHPVVLSPVRVSGLGGGHEWDVPSDPGFDEAARVAALLEYPASHYTSLKHNIASPGFGLMDVDSSNARNVGILTWPPSQAGQGGVLDTDVYQYIDSNIIPTGAEGIAGKLTPTADPDEQRRLLDWDKDLLAERFGRGIAPGHRAWVEDNWKHLQQQPAYQYVTDILKGKWPIAELFDAEDWNPSAIGVRWGKNK